MLPGCVCVGGGRKSGVQRCSCIPMANFASHCLDSGFVQKTCMESLSALIHDADVLSALTATGWDLPT